MRHIVALVLVLLLCAHFSQECSYWNEPCDGNSPCCEGPCSYGGGDSVGFCFCKSDSWWSSCSKNEDCCSHVCNTRGYCGCISSGFYCTEGYDGECCGNGHIKTCTRSFPLHFECY